MFLQKNEFVWKEQRFVIQDVQSKDEACASPAKQRRECSFIDLGGVL